MLPQVQQLGAGLPPQMLPLLMQMQVPFQPCVCAA